jgi:hypothetical protein
MLSIEGVEGGKAVATSVAPTEAQFFLARLRIWLHADRYRRSMTRPATQASARRVAFRRIVK